MKHADLPLRKRILVVEDEKPILQFIQRGLTYKGFAVLTAQTGEEALAVAATGKPDLILLDVMLPDFSGIEVCRSLRFAETDALPILMLTAKDERTDKIIGLESGADDYITKPFDFEELVARIRAALRRVERTRQVVGNITVGDLTIDTAVHRVWRAEKLISLTKREYDLLELLVQNARRVLTKERIFELIWGYDHEAGLEVVKVYINTLRTKLNAGGKSDLISTVRGVGYLFEPQGKDEK